MRALIIGGGSVVAPHNKQDYDLYCSVNSGIQDGDCDIWFNGFVDLDIQRKVARGINFKMLVRTSVEDEMFKKKFPPEWTDKVSYMDINLYKVLRNKFRPLKPTTGLAAIWYLLNIEDMEVFYTGYDSYDTPNRFDKEVNHKASSHDFNKEKLILEQWERTLNLVRLGTGT